MGGGVEEELHAKVSRGEAGSGQGGRRLVEILCLSGSGGGQGGDFNCKQAVGFLMALCAHAQDRRLEEAWAQVEATLGGASQGQAGSCLALHASLRV